MEIVQVNNIEITFEQLVVFAERAGIIFPDNGKIFNSNKDDEDLTESFRVLAELISKRIL